MSDLDKLWLLLRESNAGVMKIILDTHGIKRSRAMILVDGVNEVKQIIAAIEVVENSWKP